MHSNLAFPLVGIPALLLVTIALATLIFEIAMFIHVIRNQQLPSSTRILWALGMILIHPFVAIVYYFTDYKKSQRV